MAGSEPQFPLWYRDPLTCAKRFWLQGQAAPGSLEAETCPAQHAFSICCRSSEPDFHTPLCTMPAPPSGPPSRPAPPAPRPWPPLTLARLPLRSFSAFGVLAWPPLVLPPGPLWSLSASIFALYLGGCITGHWVSRRPWCLQSANYQAFPPQHGPHQRSPPSPSKASDRSSQPCRRPSRPSGPLPTSKCQPCKAQSFLCVT